MRESAIFAISAVFVLCASMAEAGRLIVDLGDWPDVTFIGAVNRWNDDGTPRRPVDPKAKIDAPAADAKAVRDDGSRWTFDELPKGKYDLVILARQRVRIDGFQFVPVKQFDPIFPADTLPDAEARRSIIDDIAASRHYENRVVPLGLAGDSKAVRVLVMLIRDKPTSYESDSPGAATIRHEIWQFSWNYGGWEKERQTRILDRSLLGRDELRKWTWLWDPKLGGIEVGAEPVTIKYEMPSPSDRRLKGLYPY